MKNTEEKLFEIIEILGVLKRIPRMGWRIRGVADTESVAAHSFRVVFIAMLLGDVLSDKYEINNEKLLRIATLHEVSESILTDLALAPALAVGRDIKHKAELGAFKKIFKDFQFENKYLDLWMEFENASSIEGKISKLADKIDMLVQAYEYEKQGCRNLEDFWKNSENFETYEIEFIDIFFKYITKKHSDLLKK